MQQLKLFSAASFFILILLACSGTADNKAASDSNDSKGAAGSGKDMYYEYTISTVGKNASINGTTKMYISSKGDMREEMNTNTTMAGRSNPIKIIIIGHSDQPDESISIDDDAKTYTINHFNRDDLNTGEKMQSTVTKVGEEKILGFNCVHARIVTITSIESHYSTVDTLNLWRSNDVPILASVKDLMYKFESKTGNLIYSPQAVTQLKQMGCDGFMVKMMIHSKASTKEELTKVENKALPESMFQIPAGYKEDKEGL